MNLPNAVDQKLINKAIHFATEKHKGQTRKYTGVPYVLHPIAVGEIVSRVNQDPEVLAAAILHDVVEDTQTTHDDIYREFGPMVNYYVWANTKQSVPEDGNRAVRMAIDREHYSQGNGPAQTIKVADMIHNTVDIVGNDRDFARVYLGEKALLLNTLIQADPHLREAAMAQVGNAIVALGLNPRELGAKPGVPALR